jgi:hypothetical protein
VDVILGIPWGVLSTYCSVEVISAPLRACKAELSRGDLALKVDWAQIGFEAQNDWIPSGLGPKAT